MNFNGQKRAREDVGSSSNASTGMPSKIPRQGGLRSIPANTSYPRGDTKRVPSSGIGTGSAIRPWNNRSTSRPLVPPSGRVSSTRRSSQASPRQSKEEKFRLLVSEAKLLALETEIENEKMQLAKLDKRYESTLDAAEQMVALHESHKKEIHFETLALEQNHREKMKALVIRTHRSHMRRKGCKEEECDVESSLQHIRSEKEVLHQLYQLEENKTHQKQEELTIRQETTEAYREAAAAMEAEAHLMEDASYGLSGEVKEIVLQMQAVEKEVQETIKVTMKLELERRELFSYCEALNGSIRVYSRVRGSKGVEKNQVTGVGAVSSLDESQKQVLIAPSVEHGISSLRTTLESRTTTNTEEDPSDVRVRILPHPQSPAASRVSSRESSSCSAPSVVTDGKLRPGVRDHPAARTNFASAKSQTSMDSSRSRAAKLSNGKIGLNGSRRVSNDALARGQDSTEESGPLFTFGYSREDEAIAQLSSVHTSDAEPAHGTDSLPTSEPREAIPVRTITLHQSRRNATSTGRDTTSETFKFDRVFDSSSSQASIFEEVKPLILSAVDGFSVCIFAYGQTGSGKTFTMEGELSEPEKYGIIPRGMSTIFSRQAELAEEGWHYQLRCSVVEIYNDTIRDLLQPPSMYESGGVAFQQANYHVIQHQLEERTTVVTRMKEQKIDSYEDFQKVYQQAVRHRKTASTQLNARSSRSHCIFLLHIDGKNDTIREKCSGKLCLVDLAGSERVNDSKVTGPQLKEAININKSLLDLGKCIAAMRTNAVVPWRNSKLTHFLQMYLGAKGGKMLMIVTVSDKREHAPESANALRFASRVSQTVVGPSAKRVVKY